MWQGNITPDFSAQGEGKDAGAAAVTVAAFYKFVGVEDCAALKAVLLETMAHAHMRGTILIAPEGINGTVSAAPEAMTYFLRTLRQDPRFSDLETKATQASSHPFQRAKVKIKREIISLRQPAANPAHRVGQYVQAADWNALVLNPAVLLIDTRNTYEVAAGTFRGARDPGLARFGDFAAFADTALAGAQSRQIAMFCTGGIRCEKASAYLLAHGFTDVYHLRGGILQYLLDVPTDQSLFEGACFVFDERETVGSNDA